MAHRKRRQFEDVTWGSVREDEWLLFGLEHGSRMGDWNGSRVDFVAFWARIRGDALAERPDAAGWAAERAYQMACEEV